MFRFFVEKKIGNSFIMSEENLRHLKVVRAKNEKFICIFEGKFYLCELEGNTANILEEIEENHELSGKVVIAAALIKFKRFELLIQKATELGATEIIPVITDRVNTKLVDNVNKKIQRWNQIALNAAQQSFRNKRLIIKEVETFKEILELDFQNKFISHEKINTKTKSSFPVDSLFFIGPEGGFTDQEVDEANKKGFESISLGKRILRSETASLFILSKIQQ